MTEPTGTATNWNGDKLTVTQQTQTWNPDIGGMDITDHGSITATADEWLDIVVQVLDMLPGKPTPDGSEYALGPADASADLIGDLIAQKLRALP